MNPQTLLDSLSNQWARHSPTLICHAVLLVLLVAWALRDNVVE